MIRTTSSEQTTVGAGTTRRRLIRSDNWQAWVYLIPTIVGLCLFSVGPVITSFGLSFTKYEIVTPPIFIGLANYQQLASEPLFWKILMNTVFYTVGLVPASVILSLLLAILVNQKLPFVVAFRSLYFLPVVSSIVAVSLVWSWLYDPQFGAINDLLFQLFHINGPIWLGSTTWALPALVIMGIWKSVGYNMVIFLAGLQGVPEELYEAAKVDGAGGLRRFWHITLPMVSPTSFFVMVITIIGSFQVFEQTYVMTQGGPAYATLTLSYYIYQNAFEWFHMGYAAALGYVLFFLILIVTLIQMRFQRRWVFYR